MTKKKVKRASKFRRQQTSYINELKFSSLPYNKHLISRAKSVCMGEALPRSLRSVCTQTSVKILPYRPPAWLIRAKYEFKLALPNWFDLLGR